MLNNKLKISLITTLTSSLISLSSFGQFFDTDQSPLSVKWRQINFNGFQLIYPIELEKEAQRMAGTIAQIYPHVGKSLNRSTTSIPIVFQNRGTIANGFVQLAPKKSQFYTTPPQQFDSQDWLNNLAVHELRHVAQFDKIAGREKFFLSEEIHFAYLGASIPTWAFEGDAVVTETSLTNAGRGRQPSWIMPFRAALLSGKNLSYSKAYFGSNKDVTPGYYQLGYLLNADLRSSFGNNIMDSIFSDINRRPLRPYPFSSSLKKFTGKRTAAYYNEVLEKLKDTWSKQDLLTTSENYKHLNQTSKYLSNYYLPVQLENQQILTLKQTKADVPNFVLINNDGSEELLFKIGYQEQAWLSYGNGKLVWDEIRYDPRYRQRNYSVINTYDFRTKIKRQLTFKSRLFSPAISGDGKKMIAVEIDLSNRSKLVWVDLTNGKTRSLFDNPENLILQTPALNYDGTKQTWISVSEKGKSIWYADGKPEKLTTEINQQLSRPMFIGDKISFNAHYGGIDNIYDINPNKRKIMALTASKYGAFNASLANDGKSILFNDFRSTGYGIAKTEISEKEVPKNHFVYFAEAAEKQEATGNVFEQIKDTTFQSTRFRPIGHLFNFHSISPTVDDDDRLGLQLKSNDLLNNLDLFAGATYHSDLRKLEYQAGFSFKSLYPVFSATFRNRPRRGFYLLNNSIQQADWREDLFDVKASLPLNFNKFNHNYSFLASVGTSYTRRNFAPKESQLFNSTIRFPMNYQIGFTHSVRAAERDVAPRWLQSVSFAYFNQPFDAVLNGELLAFESLFYFPGLAKNHSFSASFNHQQTSGTLRFNNEIPTVYGYNQIPAKTELANTLLLNYRFPIFFPDAEIGGLAYIRNVRGGLFSHYENIGIETNMGNPKTFGFELRSSMNLLRYQPVVDLGARMVFVNKTYNKSPILEFIFNYSF